MQWYCLCCIMLCQWSGSIYTLKLKPAFVPIYPHWFVWTHRGPRCSRCMMLILSELLILLCLTASWTCDVVSCIGSACSLLICVCIACLLCWWIVCWMDLSRCGSCLLLNVCVWIGLYCPCMVFHSLCLFCLLSHCLFRCSLQMSVLCCCMREVISGFLNCGIVFIFSVCCVDIYWCVSYSSKCVCV